MDALQTTAVLALAAAVPIVKIFITIIVIAIVTALALWVLQQLNAPAPFGKIILILGVVVAILYVFQETGLLSYIG